VKWYCAEIDQIDLEEDTMLDLSYKVETNHEDNPDDGDEALDLSGHTLCQYLQSGKPTELLLDQPKKFSFLKFAKQT